MTMFVLFIVIIIGILFAISLYMYENSLFSKLTGYSYMMVWTNKEIRFRYRLSQKLKKASGEYKLLFNVILPDSGRKIDALLIHESGIHIISAKQMGGWIYGKETDIHWAQVLERGQMNKFENPVIENKLQVINLKTYLPEVKDELYHSLIVFDQLCSFRSIEYHSNNIEIIKMNGISGYLDTLKSIRQAALTTGDIAQIANKLEPFVKKQLTGKMSAN